MARLRIGIDAHGVGGHSLGCGNETYFQNLIPHLLALDGESEYHVFVRAPEPFRALAERHSNLRLVSLRPRSQWLQRPLSLPYYARRHRLDVLHVPFVRPAGSGAKTVVTVHDLSFETLPELFRGMERRRMRWLVKASCRRADRIFTVSECSKRQLREIYGVPESKIVLTPNAADHMAAWSGAAELPPWPRPFLLFAGLLQPRKNIARLLAAFDLLKRRTSLPHALVLAGKWGWGAAELRRTLAALQHRDRVHVAGYLPTAQLAAAMRQADLFVFPSLFEGFGIPPLEAQWFGTPALVSRAGSFPEIYGDSALYCEPRSVESIAAEMQRGLEDTALRQQLGERGRVNSRRGSWSRTAAIALAGYRACLRPAEVAARKEACA